MIFCKYFPVFSVCLLLYNYLNFRVRGTLRAYFLCCVLIQSMISMYRSACVQDAFFFLIYHKKSVPFLILQVKFKLGVL